MAGFWTAPNSHFPRCVDCRPVAAIVAWDAGAWHVTARGDAARQDLGPQFPGGSLVFLRALEVVGGVGRWRAFEHVERASAQAGLGVQIHIDDDAGRRNLSIMRDDALIALVTHQHTGCGFVAHTWGPQADMVVGEAKRRHWRVLLVGGPMQPRGAWINLRPGETFDTSAAADAGMQHFNLDVAAARPVFAALEALIHQPGFAERAETWMIETYGALALVLGAPQFKTRT